MKPDIEAAPPAGPTPKVTPPRVEEMTLAQLEAFEREHGIRPSWAETMSRRDGRNPYARTR